MDWSKSFNMQQTITLGITAVVVTALFNIPKIKELWNRYVTRKDSPVVADEEREVSEAEYRVMLFGWIDEIRYYAQQTNNSEALKTANKLINDLLATNETEVPEVTN